MDFTDFVIYSITALSFIVAFGFELITGHSFEKSIMIALWAAVIAFVACFVGMILLAISIWFTDWLDRKQAKD